DRRRQLPPAAPPRADGWAGALRACAGGARALSECGGGGGGQPRVPVILTVTAVPFPAIPVTSTSPPIKRARSRIPRRPIDDGPAFSSSVIPLPLSLISRATVPSSAIIVTSTLVAPEWRRMFVRAS